MGTSLETKYLSRQNLSEETWLGLFIIMSTFIFFLSDSQHRMVIPGNTPVDELLENGQLGGNTSSATVLPVTKSTRIITTILGNMQIT